MTNWSIYVMAFCSLIELSITILEKLL